MVVEDARNEAAPRLDLVILRVYGMRLHLQVSNSWYQLVFRWIRIVAAMKTMMGKESHMEQSTETLVDEFDKPTGSNRGDETKDNLNVARGRVWNYSADLVRADS